MNFVKIQTSPAAGRGRLYFTFAYFIKQQERFRLTPLVQLETLP
jgi:hypothetical protein